MKFPGGRVPYGFQVQGGNLEFDYSHRGQILLRLMKGHEAGLSYRTMAQEATLMGWEAPNAPVWNYGTVARVVKNGKKYSAVIPLQAILNN